MLMRGRWQTGAMAERDLLILSEEPFNAETRLERQQGLLTPAGRHYVRTHFPIPAPPTGFLIDGAVESAASWSIEEIRALPSRTIAVTLECAGNGRRFLDPAVPGEQWGLGAVGTAEWTGVPLRLLLDRAGALADAVEVSFRGADEGVPKDLGRRIAYERSLPIADTRSDDVLVAYAMDGEEIPIEHGGPLRLVVPGWYGMASVKWLARITVLQRPLSAFYQTDRYVIDGHPLRTIAPRAVITVPVDGAELESDRPLEIQGYAWSGAGRPITAVAVSAEPVSLTGQRTWREAQLGPAISAYAWRAFSIRVLMPAGSDQMEFTVVARATDASGATQPLGASWNKLGYSNNAVRSVRVRVGSATPLSPGHRRGDR
jgi:DMSO/TMAO reductase YedYZ molybdopterin-dependent catalytic subunit